MVKAVGPLVIAAVAAAAPNPNCGPSSAEVGTALVVSLPLVALATLVVQMGLVWLWRRFRPTLGVSWIDAAWLVGWLALVGGIAALVARDKLGYVGLAFWLLGCSYASITMVLMRLLLALRPGPRLVITSQLLVSLVYLVPSMLLMFESARHAAWEDPFVAMVIFPGLGGWTTGGIALALVVEALIRGGRAAGARRESPAPRAG